jgi:hypothetical protein
MFLLACSVVIALIAVIFVQDRWRHRRFYELFNKIPQADGNYPLIGCFWRFLKTDPRSLFKALSSASAKGPSPRRAFFGPACFVVVDDPEHIQKVLISRLCLNKTFLHKKMIPNGEKSQQKIC